MDYELLYNDYKPSSEKLKSTLATQQRLFKRIQKSADAGDLRSVAKDLEALALATRNLSETIDEAANTIAGFKLEEYLASGDYASQFVAECESNGIDIVGEGTSWEVFPYRIKIEPSDESVLVNGRKAAGVRPSALVETLAAGRAKLLSAPFKAVQFANELAAAYDLAIVATAKGKQPTTDADVYLSTVYKYLAPMSRFRREYDIRAYAFDLARLYDTADVLTADGRRIQFGPSRNNNRAIRILDKYNNELFIATVRFFDA